MATERAGYVLFRALDLVMSGLYIQGEILLIASLLFLCRRCSLVIAKLVTTGVFGNAAEIFVIAEVKVHVL